MTRAVSELPLLSRLREASAVLEAAGIETARHDAEWLLAAVLRTERFAAYVNPARELSADEVEGYRALVSRRAAHEPLQHLTGFEDFHGLRLAVTPDVLIPRPETEGLVEWAIEIVREQPASVVADIGTGSGAIACALAWSSPRLEVLAVERSFAALSVAALNIRRLGLSRRVKLVGGDLLQPLGSLRGGLDLVIANPPYIPSAVVASLPPEVAAFEPREALDGGPDGMTVIRRIIATAPPLLRPRAWLMMEIGLDQAGPVASLMAAEGFAGIQARRDLRGVERYIGGQWAEVSAPPPGRTS